MKKTMILFVSLTVLLLIGCGESKTRQEINRRRQALKEKQATELARAQEELRRSDSLLQLTQADLAQQQKEVDEAKAALKATAEQLTALTMTRMRRDSLRTVCEVQGAKIRYIRLKQKELNDSTAGIKGSE